MGGCVKLWNSGWKISSRKSIVKYRKQKKVKTNKRNVKNIQVLNHGIVPTDGIALVHLYAVDSANFMCINLLE